MKNKTCTKNSVAYKLAQKAIAEFGTVIRTVYTTGSGRHIKNSDHTAGTITELRAHGYRVVTGNNAPRGGAIGNWVAAYPND